MAYLRLAASFTYSPQPIKGGIVKPNEYNQMLNTEKVALRKFKALLRNGRAINKYRSNARTVSVVIEVIPKRN